MKFVIVAVMFEIRFLILDYYLGFVPGSCLPSVTIMPCFKVVLTVIYSGYVIRLSSQ